MYVNISLHDYIRGITNVNHSNSSWTLDPRIEVTATANTPAVERGCGNMVSAEFNLLYRFHSAISQRDDKWTGDFFRSIYGDKDPQDIGLMEFYQGVKKYEDSIPKEPSQRCFGGLTRDPNTGAFSDAALVGILKDSIEDPAGTLVIGILPVTYETGLTDRVRRVIRRKEYPQASTNSRDSRHHPGSKMASLLSFPRGLMLISQQAGCLIERIPSVFWPQNPRYL